MSGNLHQAVSAFHEWRSKMIAGIENYKAWLDSNGFADIQQSLRIYDLIESLKSDRLTIAILAEFSRGKTELINALLFSALKRRLLPSDVGRTTMCPTEILWDPVDGPYIRLLPIETRKREDSIAALKRKTVEWIKVGIDPESPEAMVEAVKCLRETKTVSLEEAEALGLLSRSDEGMTSTVNILPGGRVEIPAWRHAIVSYPHELLRSGLTILDTPGLNALGTEPELTMSMIPGAHAVLFLLAADTGVTVTDLDIWHRFVHQRVGRAVAVLNKIDLAWDELKTDEEVAAAIERQATATAATLGLSRAHVLPLSAQKALVARIRGDAQLLARSGIEALETLIAREIVPAKQEILRNSVAREIGAMVDHSRNSIVLQFRAARDEHRALLEVAGKNRSIAQAMMRRLESDRATYQQSAEAASRVTARLREQGDALLANLSDEAIAALINRDLQFIEGAWTTAGLMKAIEMLFGYFTAQAGRILNLAGEIRRMVEETYREFHSRYGFGEIHPPALSLEAHTLQMHRLQEETRAFVRDPVSVMTEKHFLVRRFYNSLVTQAIEVFDNARTDTEAWLDTALNPLNAQLRQHGEQLAKRVENFARVRDNVSGIATRIRELEQRQLALKRQADVLTGIRAGLEQPAGAPETPAVAEARAA